MSKLGEIQSKLREMACPSCGKSNFNVVLRCDFGYEECLYTVKCESCSHIFEISTETKRLKAREPDIEERLAQSKCPYCGQRGAELNFRCDLTSRECFYFVTCKNCGQTYREYK